MGLDIPSLSVAAPLSHSHQDLQRFSRALLPAELTSPRNSILPQALIEIGIDQR
jgi:hypothetical protein